MKLKKMLFGALIFLVMGTVLIMAPILALSGQRDDNQNQTVQPAPDQIQKIEGLAGRALYNDPARQVHAALKLAQENGDTQSVKFLEYIANQPGATWLNGPSDQDPNGSKSVEAVVRTSKEADQLNQVVIYQLYAIPNRDACAEYSKGGFNTESQYLAWVKRISNALAGDAVFLIEADAIAHAINKDCINDQQAKARYSLLRKVVRELSSNDRVAATYLDVGHPEWITNSTLLVEPLKASGLEEATGVVVNVSNYIGMDEVLVWTKELLDKIGEGKTAVVDTSRNGNGAPGPEVTGEDRWCNPKGRAVGELPATSGLPEGIDAYLWIKNAGESDGSCRGYPEAGAFVPELAIDLVKNR